MKKIFTTLLAAIVLLSVALPANAGNQGFRWGIKGGLNIAGVSVKDLNADVFKNYTGFNAGLTMQLPLALGFMIQPDLWYSQTGATINLLGVTSGTMVSQSIALPIGVQWGISLLNGNIRPYVEVSPYIGYSLAQKVSFAGETEKIEGDQLNKFQYGVGLGVGVDIWRFQVSFRYKWGLNSVVKNNGNLGDYLEYLKNTKPHAAEISLALLF
jgi:opacity protein-like surface antigen